MIMGIGEKIAYYLFEKDMQQKELAERINMNPSVLNRIIKGSRPIRTDELEAIANVFHVTPNTLYGLNDNVSFVSSPKKFNPEKAVDLSPVKESNHVPIIGSVKCGAGGLAYEYIDEYITVDDSYPADEIRAFRCYGHSMEGDGRNSIYDGDICLVHLQSRVPNNAIAVVVIENGTESEGTLKRFHMDKNGTIVLQANNPAYPPRVFAGEDANKVHIVGRVVEIRRKN